jgi:hypothetical protein
MSKGKVTPPEIVEKIKLCVASGISYMETSRICGVADSTVHTIMNRINSSEEERVAFEKLKEQKQREFKEKANKDFDAMMKDTFEKLMTRSAKVIDKAIDEDKLSPSDAIKIVGITFDKRQVMTGGKTANVGLSFDDLLKEINKGDEF